MYVWIGFIASSALSLILLSTRAIRFLRTEWRSLEHTMRNRQRLKEALVKAYGWARYKSPPGRHRLEPNPKSHRSCTKDDPCAYRHAHYHRYPATFYTIRAQQEQDLIERTINGLFGYTVTLPYQANVSYTPRHALRPHSSNQERPENASAAI